MQNRDNYDHDYIYRHYPKIDYLTFQRDMLKNKGMYQITFSKEEQEKFQNDQSTSQYLVTGSLFGSITLMIFYNKIPLISRVQSKWKKFFMKCGIFFIPVSLVATYCGYTEQQYIADLYTKYREPYYRFKQTGDAKELNPIIQFSDL